ncbi:Dyp peroxidase [Mycena latifolia]|nr:Dyp peroxidase [Mycena latifolia]
MKLNLIPTLTSLSLFAGLVSSRTTSLLIDAAGSAANVAALNLDDIQGDILIGMKKKKELFFFFGIAKPQPFKNKLKSDILPLDSLNDTAFTRGQAADNGTLGDPGTKNWVPQFLGSLKSTLGDSVTEIYTLQGEARPGKEEGHEHFGFLDGISNPAVTGFQTPLLGQAVVPTGEILVGEKGDSEIGSRPAWAKDGSFLAFRQLKQLVPEFNKFLTDNPIREPGLTDKNGSDLLGARMVGRWKSGAPVFLSPRFDDPALGANRFRTNPSPIPGCPFSAHIRKTRPRADLGTENTGRHIVRGGIPYGPEVTAGEASSHTTKIERGLAFVAYQSNIENGFQFLQHSWASNPNFVEPGVGFDPIIDFVVSRGGEYFFSPSLSAIRNTLSA